MKHLFCLLGISLILATPAHAACYADYKAKRDNPLRLHYGVAEIAGPCTKANAKTRLEPRLDAAGWTLLTIESVFDDAGLDDRKDSAGEYFLLY